jgi:hypothetical protein
MEAFIAEEVVLAIELDDKITQRTARIELLL